MVEESNEILLREGEVVTDIVQLDEGWWQGRNAQGHVGLFPANYVEAIAAQAPVSHAPAPVAMQQQPAPVPVQAPVPPAPVDQGGATAIALYDYDATESNEITFLADVLITQIQFVSEDWWSGSVGGVIGLCKCLFDSSPSELCRIASVINTYCILFFLCLCESNSYSCK